MQLLRERGTAETPGYQRRPIRAVIPISPDGRFLGSFVDNADPEHKQGKRINAPYVKRSSATRPILFADGADYLFGLPDGEADRARALRRQDAHLILAERCCQATGSPLARAARRFLLDARDDTVVQARIADQTSEHPGDYVVRVGDALVTDDPQVRRFWAQQLGLSPVAGSAGGAGQPCAVCGVVTAIPPTWPVPIKGIPGGQASGTQLVSMNKDVYESFGQTRATGAGTCGPCAERIGNALNALLADPARRLRVGPMVYVSWCDGEDTFDQFDWLDRPSPEAVRQLLASPLTASGKTLGADGRVYTVALSAYKSRVVVRDWYDTTVADACKKLASYFRGQLVVGPWGEPPEPLRLVSLAGATVRELRDLAPHAVAGLLASILAGRPLPPAILAAVVRRVQAEDAPKVTRPQAALMTWFLGQRFQEDAVPHELNVTLDNPAYQCGRALAEIDAIQRDALGKVNATVVDRYFGAASSRPATVLGMLIRNAQDHLKKLRSTRDGAAMAHDARLAEILGRLQPAGFPATLPLIEQTWFCIGFYHQRAAARQAAREGHERALAGQAANNEEAE